MGVREGLREADTVRVVVREPVGDCVRERVPVGVADSDGDGS